MSALAAPARLLSTSRCLLGCIEPGSAFELRTGHPFADRREVPGAIMNALEREASADLFVGDAERTQLASPVVFVLSSHDQA